MVKCFIKIFSEYNVRRTFFRAGGLPCNYDKTNEEIYINDNGKSTCAYSSRANINVAGVRLEGKADFHLPDDSFVQVWRTYTPIWN